MKALVTSIVTVALCIGMASQTLAQGTNDVKKAHGEHEGPFAKMDANGDGKISWDEMLAFHAAKWQAAYQEHAAKVTPKQTWDEVLAKRTAELKTRFQAMDANGDGFVTKEEFKAYREAHKGEHEGKPDQGAPAPTPPPAKS
jgi:Ca2+-binding EF-hand superfamily protein